MNERVLRTLEYDKITEKLAAFADSAPGKERCLALKPSCSRYEISRTLTETGDAIARLLRGGNVSFGSNRDFGETIGALKIGRTLDMRSLLQIASMLENCARVKAYGQGADGGAAEIKKDALTEYFLALEPLTSLSKEIRRCILQEDEIAPDASPALRQIRRNQMLAGDRIHEQLNRMVTGSCRNYLQDPVITLRGDRYCLPVRAEYKGQVPGIVHDLSSSGQTLFIEPTAVVELNNKIRELQLQEQAEIERILSELSQDAAAYIQALADNQTYLTLLDFIFAKASYALELEAQIPKIAEGRFFDLKKARHPLLDQKKAVPIHVYLGKEFSLLIITGPNTGGKTVTLKTAGLLQAMGQAGLAIPAEEDSTLSIFREIYADIGDEQSIEQNLSTFSAHMTNTVRILKEADEDCLCLFDELGAGTDPTEGAALAISILESLHARGIRTMATTHYSELKVYALTTEGVKNAGCEFDVDSLRPTYRLLIGAPGKSNAFAISSRLGLPSSIIEAARSHIDKDSRKMEDLFADLETSRKELEREKEEVTRYKQETEALKEKLEKQTRQFDETADDLLREANEEAARILLEAKETANAAIKEIRKGGGEGLSALERTRTRLNEAISARNGGTGAQKNTSAGKNRTKTSKKILKPEQLLPGTEVLVRESGLRGSVNSRIDASGDLFIMCGIMRMKVNVRDLSLAEEKPTSLSKKQRDFSGKGGQMDLSRGLHISSEINLIGKNSDDAIAALDKYLDDAYLAHLHEVRVVHGKGTGTLRKAVGNYLKHSPYVKSYSLGEYGEGDAGVTIVKFK